MQPIWLQDLFTILRLKKGFSINKNLCINTVFNADLITFKTESLTKNATLLFRVEHFQCKYLPLKNKMFDVNISVPVDCIWLMSSIAKKTASTSCYSQLTLWAISTSCYKSQLLKRQIFGSLQGFLLIFNLGDYI